MKTPQQLARELAEKCAHSLYVCDDPQCLSCSEAAETILRELNLEQLIETKQAERELSEAYLRVRALVNAWDTNHGGEDRFEVTEDKIKQLLADKERLDWLEDECYDWQLRISPGDFRWKSLDEPSIRKAIDSAMSAQGKDK